MAKTKEFKGIQEQIIESAGTIYNYLSNKGEVSINKMKKDLSLNLFSFCLLKLHLCLKGSCKLYLQIQ